jgi:hypothetical protein
MPIQNQPSQGLSQNVTIRQGRVTSKDKTAEAGAVVKINKGQEAAAWRAAGANGADDFRFRTDAGDVYIASGVGFEKLGLQIGNAVDINGVKGRVTDLNDEVNSKAEITKSRLTMGIFGGGGMGLVGAVVGLMGTGSTIGILALGGIGIAAGVGIAIFGVKNVVNLDRIKLFGSEVG